MLHVDELKFSTGEVSSRAKIFLGFINTSTTLKTRTLQSGMKSKISFALCLYVMIHKRKPLLKKSCEILKMKRQKSMEKVVLALSSALTTCLLLLQYCSILALKIIWVNPRRETTPLLD